MNHGLYDGYKREAQPETVRYDARVAAAEHLLQAAHGHHLDSSFSK